MSVTPELAQVFPHIAVQCMSQTISIRSTHSWVTAQKTFGPFAQYEQALRNISGTQTAWPPRNGSPWLSHGFLPIPWLTARWRVGKLPRVSWSLSSRPVRESRAAVLCSSLLPWCEAIVITSYLHLTGTYSPDWWEMGVFILQLETNYCNCSFVGSQANKSNWKWTSLPNAWLFYRALIHKVKPRTTKQSPLWISKRLFLWMTRFHSFPLLYSRYKQDSLL